MTKAIDTSELTESLDQLREDADSLHSYLDGFIEGGTRQLVGQNTRDQLHVVLQNLDQHLARIDELRHADIKRTKGRVTATMTKKVASAQEHLDRLRAILYPILSVHPRHDISRTDASNAFSYLDVLRDELQALGKQMK